MIIMLEGNKLMQAAALDRINQRNQLVIQKGDAAFKQTGTLEKQIAEFVKADHNQVKEADFVLYFLPFFAKDPAPQVHGVTIMHWVGATGDMMKPVDVINSRGNVIVMKDGVSLTIPAIYNRDAVRAMYARQGGNNAATGQIIEEAKRYENMGEQTVQQVLGKYLSQKAKAAKVPGVALQVAQQWNRIMAHYGREPLYPLPGLAGETTALGTSSPSTDPTAGSGGDDLYYELP
jgi:hypothetical protein